VRRIVYVDMDGVLVDFKSGMARVPRDVLAGTTGATPPTARTTSTTCRGSSR
jgi:hypothetical protein